MQAEQFYDTLTTEIVSNVLELDATRFQKMQRYYVTLADNPQDRPFYRHNWIRRTEPMARLIKSLPKRQAPWRVLDAGCGLGTESIFWSTLRDDVVVIATDINPERVAVAKGRQKAYENRLGKSLNLRFLEQDVFSVLKAERFDLVWVMEAISHIDPVEKFLAAVSENLGQDGYMVISDSHLLNPAVAWRVFRLRRKGVTLHTHRTTSTGENISYAQEQLFTVGQLSKMLAQTGFSSTKAQMSIFFPPSLARFPRLFSFCTWSDSVLNKIPLIRNLGGIYTIVANK